MEEPTKLKLVPKLRPFSDKPARIKVAYGGRGSGKSWTVARLLLLIGYDRPVRILCTREIQKTIKESVHQLLVDQIKALGLQGFYKVTENGIRSIDFDEDGNRTEFIFAGLRSDDIHKLKSLEGVDYCWVEEASVVTAKSLDVLNPTIRKEGSEIWFTYNPELDTDPVHDRYVVNRFPDSIVVKVNYKDNPFFPDVLDQERLYLKKVDTSEGQMKYKNIWEGVCLPAVEGAIYANEVARLFDEGRVRALDYDSRGVVHAIWDLGWGVSSVILAQRFASTIQIIGYLERRHETYADITRELKQLPYRWGKHFMPHDASHRDPKYGRSHKDVMQELGWDVAPVENVGIENGITNAREMFRNLYISDGEDCKRLIHCLRRYRRQIPATTEHPGAPLHDEYSHGADAFRYLAVVADELVNETPVVKDPYRSFDSGYAA